MHFPLQIKVLSEETTELPISDRSEKWEEAKKGEERKDQWKNVAKFTQFGDRLSQIIQGYRL